MDSCLPPKTKLVPRSGHESSPPRQQSGLPFATQHKDILANRKDLPLITNVNFPSGTPVTIGIEFHMKRPSEHFKPESSRSWSNLITRALTGDWMNHLFTPNLNDMITFVLDSLNGVVYDDKRQVVLVIAEKFYDDDNDCKGKTVVKAYHNEYSSLCYHDLAYEIP